MGSAADAGSNVAMFAAQVFRCFAPPSARSALVSRQPAAMAMPRGTVADALSNLGGFDAWWEEQRQGAAQRPPDFAFEYLPPTQLSLTAQAAQSDPVRCGRAVPSGAPRSSSTRIHRRHSSGPRPPSCLRPCLPGPRTHPVPRPARRHAGASADPHTGPDSQAAARQAHLPSPSPRKHRHASPGRAGGDWPEKPSEDDKVDQDRDAFDREA